MPPFRRTHPALPALTAAACAVVLFAAAATRADAADQRTRCDFSLQVGALPEGVAVGFADIAVSYARPAVFPPDQAGRVNCHGTAPGAAAAAANKILSSSAGSLQVAFASEDGAPGSSSFLRCEFYAAGSVGPDDFPQVTLLQARSASLVPIEPPPSVSLGEIRCGDAATTTTTTSTTTPPTTSTTAPSATTTTVPAPSTTTTTLAPEDCSFVLRLAGGAKIRRAKFRVDWTRALGEVPRPVAASCLGVGSTGVAVVAGPGNRELTVEAVSPSAIGGPAELARCAFVPEGGYATSGDFDVAVTLAGDATGAAAATLPVVEAGDVQCPSLTTTTTTTSTTTTTLPPPPCGDADGNGLVQAGDALLALRAAVGLPSPCTPARCDVDGSGAVKAADALGILRAAVGSDVLLACPD